MCLNKKREKEHSVNVNMPFLSEKSERNIAIFHLLVFKKTYPEFTRELVNNKEIYLSNNEKGFKSSLYNLITSKVSLATKYPVEANELICLIHDYIFWDDWDINRVIRIITDEGDP